MVFGTFGSFFGVLVPSAQASAPVFTNNGTAGGNVYPGNQDIDVLDITLPAVDIDTFLDGDGIASTAAGIQENIAIGSALAYPAIPAAPNLLCGNTDGTTAPANIVHDADGICGSTESNVSRVDSATNVGQGNSLVLDASGYPVMSYYDATNQKLKVMYCNDVNCAGGNESITTPDNSANNIGAISFLRLDGSGNPMILYYDATPVENLVFMHCNDPNCAGGNESIPFLPAIGPSPMR